MLMEAGRKMSTSKVMTGRDLKSVDTVWNRLDSLSIQEEKRENGNDAVPHLSSTALSVMKAPTVTSAKQKRASENAQRSRDDGGTAADSV